VLKFSEAMKTGKKWGSDCVSEHKMIVGNYKKTKFRTGDILNKSLLLYPGTRTLKENVLQSNENVAESGGYFNMQI
jgi:hypothetical protein